jgi:glycosyltransferase involved in cell wall biosynthesis
MVIKWERELWFILQDNVKLLYYGINLGPPWVEGLRNTVRNLGRRLSNEGVEVTVLTKGSFGSQIIEGMRYIGLPIGGDTYAANAPATMVAIAAWLSRHSKEFDVIHGHSSFPLIATPALFSRRTSLFTQYSPLAVNEEFLSEASIFQKALFKFSKSTLPVLLSAPKVRFIAISARVAKSFPRILSRRVTQIPVGVDFTKFSRRIDTGYLREELEVNDEKVVLFAGDVTPWKGGEDFLSAAKLVLDAEPKTVFLFLTKNTYEYEKRRVGQLTSLAASLGIQRSVRFLSRRPDIDAVYALADVVALPYRSMFSFMSTPLSLLEAMAAGKPVVATEAGDMADIVSGARCGFLTKPFDYKGLAKRTLELLRDSALSKALGENAARYAQKLDWSNICRAYLETYRKMV